MPDFVEILPTLNGKDVYFYLDKENPGWSSDGGAELHFHSDKEHIILDMGDLEQVSYLNSSLYHVLGPERVLLAWDAKELFSYLKGRTGFGLELHGTVFDIKLISSYLGMADERPSSFKSALSLLKRCLSDPNWKTFSKFYAGVYKPLFSQVLPDIETCCLVDNKRRICVYPTYSIEGQANGRLKATLSDFNSYNPHSIGPAEKFNLRPKDYDDLFLYIDYKNMEVNVLQWLSGDNSLAEAISSGDTYKRIWQMVTGQKPTESHRKLCKEIFLPVVFGQGKSSLSKKLYTSEKNASKFIDRIVKTFPVAFDWVNSQSTDGNNTASDAFGRRRTFQEQYKIKNFCIQSPSSMICLRKLVLLHGALDGRASICYHLHDGYCLLCKKNEIRSIMELATSVLEGEDSMFPGLNMRVSCEGGPRLDEMQTLTKGNLHENSRLFSRN